MINNLTLMGRLTSDPELKQTTSGKSVTSFNVAVDRRFQGKSEEKKTDFIPCVAWGNNAEFITKWFHKGDMLAITGEIQTRNYEDKNGNKRTAVEVVVGEASFCGGKKESTPAVPYTANDNKQFEEMTNDDDLPF